VLCYRNVKRLPAGNDAAAGSRYFFAEMKRKRTKAAGTFDNIFIRKIYN